MGIPTANVSPLKHYIKQGLKTMSTLTREDMLLDIFDEVQENFPYLDEDKQIEIANKRFEDLCQ